MAQVAASQKRYEYEIEHMQSMDVSYESAGGRISDADFAREATALARSSIKKGLATQVMSNSSNLKDILIPLTTNHHRSHVLSASL